MAKTEEFGAGSEKADDHASSASAGLPDMTSSRQEANKDTNGVFRDKGALKVLGEVGGWQCGCGVGLR